MQAGIELDGITFSASALDGKPEWAMEIAKVVTVFSLSEGAIGGIFGLLKHEDSEEALRQLKRMGTNKLRSDAVKKLTASVLDPAAAAAVDGVIDLALDHATKRNKIAHGVWGFKEGQSGVVHVVGVKKLINFYAALLSNADNPEHLTDKLKAEVATYTIDQLRELQREGSDVLRKLMEVYVALAKRAAATMPIFTADTSTD